MNNYIELNKTGRINGIYVKCVNADLPKGGKWDNRTDTPCRNCVFYDEKNKSSCNPILAPAPCAGHLRLDGKSVKFLRHENRKEKSGNSKD